MQLPNKVDNPASRHGQVLYKNTTMEDKKNTRKIRTKRMEESQLKVAERTARLT
jgi:hypothetical protein